MAAIVKGIFRHLDPEQLKNVFLIAQVVFGALIVFTLWSLGRNKSESVFKVREADTKKPRPPGSKESSQIGQSAQAGQDLGAAKMKMPETFRLSGIRIDGAPHEVLGIPARATEAEIQSAYRELMKRYHPDRVGRPGTREWNDAQKIAEAINNARKKMLDSLHSQSPNRSGR